MNDWLLARLTWNFGRVFASSFSLCPFAAEVRTTDIIVVSFGSVSERGNEGRGGDGFCSQWGRLAEQRRQPAPPTPLPASACDPTRCHVDPQSLTAVVSILVCVRVCAVCAAAAVVAGVCVRVRGGRCPLL